jgi:hypothetical protein
METLSEENREAEESDPEESFDSRSSDEDWLPGIPSDEDELSGVETDVVEDTVSPWHVKDIVAELVSAAEGEQLEAAKYEIRNVHKRVMEKLRLRDNAPRDWVKEAMRLIFHPGITGILRSVLCELPEVELFKFLGSFSTMCFTGKCLSQSQNPRLQVHGSPFFPMPVERVLMLIGDLARTTPPIPATGTGESPNIAAMKVLKPLEEQINSTMIGICFHENPKLLLDDHKMPIFSKRCPAFGMSLQGGRTTRVQPVSHELCLAHSFLLVSSNLQTVGVSKSSAVMELLAGLHPTSRIQLPNLTGSTIICDRGYNDHSDTMSVLRDTQATLLGTIKSGSSNCFQIDADRPRPTVQLSIRGDGAETYYVADSPFGYTQALYINGRGKAIPLWVTDRAAAGRWVFIPKNRKPVQQPFVAVQESVERLTAMLSELIVITNSQASKVWMSARTGVFTASASATILNAGAALVTADFADVLSLLTHSPVPTASTSQFSPPPLDKNSSLSFLRSLPAQYIQRVMTHLSQQILGDGGRKLTKIVLTERLFAILQTGQEIPPLTAELSVPFVPLDPIYKAFLKRTLLKPLQADSAADRQCKLGLKSEPLALRQFPAFVAVHHLTISEMATTGLCCHRSNYAGRLFASPDGICLCQEAEGDKLPALIEVKTKTSQSPNGTLNASYALRNQLGAYVFIAVPPVLTPQHTAKLHQAIPNTQYLNQLVHQAASLQIHQTFLVEFDPFKKTIIRVVRLQFLQLDNISFLTRYSSAFSQISTQSQLLSLVSKPADFDYESSPLLEILESSIGKYQRDADTLILGFQLGELIRSSAVTSGAPFPDGKVIPFLIFQWNHKKGASDYRSLLRSQCQPKNPKNSGPIWLWLSALLLSLHLDVYILSNILKNFERICSAQSLKQLRYYLRAAGGFNEFMGEMTQTWTSMLPLPLTCEIPSSSDERQTESSKKRVFYSATRTNGDPRHADSAIMPQTQRRCPVCKTRGRNGCPICQQRVCPGRCQFLWHSATRLEDLPVLWEEAKQRAARNLVSVLEQDEPSRRCQACVKARKKCDGGNPCKRCCRNGREATCQAGLSLSASPPEEPLSPQLSRRQACDVCRNLKRQCVPSQISGLCLKCATTGQSCTYTALSPRSFRLPPKRPGRSDSDYFQQIEKHARLQVEEDDPPESVSAFPNPGSSSNEF